MFKRKKKIENLNKEVKRKKRKKGIISTSIILSLSFYSIFNAMPYYFHIILAIWFVYTMCRYCSHLYYWDKYNRLSFKHEEEFTRIKVNSKYADNLWNLIAITEEVARKSNCGESLFKVTNIESYGYILGKEKITPSKFKENSEYYIKLFDDYISEYGHHKPIADNNTSEKQTKTAKLNSKDLMKTLDNVVEDIKQLEKIRNIEYRE